MILERLAWALSLGARLQYAKIKRSDSGSEFSNFWNFKEKSEFEIVSGDFNELRDL